MEIKAQIDRLTDGTTSVKAYASVNLDDQFIIKDIAVMDGKNGLFARMPYRTYQDKNGQTQFSDTAYPLTTEARTALNDAVLEAYDQALNEQETETPAHEQSM